MASWDNVQTIGPPSLVPPKVDFSPLGELGTAYYQGQQLQRQQAIQQAGKDLPDNPTLQDQLKVATRLFRLGDYTGASQLYQALYAQQDLSQPPQQPNPLGMNAGAAPTYSGGAAPFVQPQAGAGVQPQPATRPVQDPNLRSDEQITPTQAATANPQQPVPPQTVPAQPDLTAQGVAALKAGQGTPTAPGVQMAVPAQPGVPQSAPRAQLVQAAQAARANPSAVDPMLPPQFQGNPMGFVNDQFTKRDAALAAATRQEHARGIGSGAALREQAKNFNDTGMEVLKALAPTPDQRNAIASGQPNTLAYAAELKRREAEIASAQPTEQDRIAKAAGYPNVLEYQKALKAAEAKIASDQPTEPARLARDQGLAGGPLEYDQRKAQQAADIAARQHEEQKTSDLLDTLTQKGIAAKEQSAKLAAVDTLGQKVNYGVIPKIQSYLGAHGIDTAGLSDIQAYERAIDFLAPQLRPEGSGRLMQQELTAFKSALGGLMTTPQGRKISVQNLKLISDFDQKVGAIAADTSLSPSQRTAKIYALEAPKLQTSLLPIGAVRMGSGNIKYRFNGGDPNDQSAWSPTSTAQQIQRFRQAP